MGKRLVRNLSLSFLSFTLSLLLSSRSVCSASKSKMRPITLITFDVDGTLVRGSSSAPDVTIHAKSFLHAAGKLAGGDDEFETKHASPLVFVEKKNYHGCTDGIISLHLLKNAFQIAPEEGAKMLPEIFRAMDAYVGRVDDQMISETTVPIDGVMDTLQRLQEASEYKDCFVCALVTGNVEGIARKKMRATGIFKLGILGPKAPGQAYYADSEDCAFLGGFGSDYCSGDLDDITRQYKDRGEQIMIAYERAKSLLKPTERIVRIVHVGDAPADVLAARYCAEEKELHKDGVTVACIGVATGIYCTSDLTEACGEALPGQWEFDVLEKGLGDENFIRALRIQTDEQEV